jgi:hypothetical protein
MLWNGSEQKHAAECYEKLQLSFGTTKGQMKMEIP